MKKLFFCFLSFFMIYHSSYALVKVGAIARQYDINVNVHYNIETEHSVYILNDTNSTQHYAWVYHMQVGSMLVTQQKQMELKPCCEYKENVKLCLPVKYDHVGHREIEAATTVYSFDGDHVHSSAPLIIHN